MSILLTTTSPQNEKKTALDFWIKIQTSKTSISGIIVTYNWKLSKKCLQMFFACFFKFSPTTQQISQNGVFLVLWDSLENQFGWSKKYIWSKIFKHLLKVHPQKKVLDPPLHSGISFFWSTIYIYIYHLNLWAEFSLSFVPELFKRCNW